MTGEDIATRLRASLWRAPVELESVLLDAVLEIEHLRARMTEMCGAGDHLAEWVNAVDPFGKEDLIRWKTVRCKGEADG